MKDKMVKLKDKFKNKKVEVLQAKTNSKENIKSFFQACGIRTVEY